jgi:hypothetical protein
MKPRLSRSDPTPRASRSTAEPGSFKASRLVRPRRGCDLLEDRGGAAIVEFALACMPVFILFFGMVQWSIIAYVHLMVQHAAFVAVRCDAVVNPGMPDAGKESDCSKGAMELLFKHVSGIGHDNLSVTFDPAGSTQQRMDTAHVSLNYQCTIPLGNVVACGASRQMPLTADAKFPNQGSAYQNIWVKS